MLNHNEDFAEKQADAFSVMRITESVLCWTTKKRTRSAGDNPKCDTARFYTRGAVQFKLRVSAVNAVRISREISRQV